MKIIITFLIITMFILNGCVTLQFQNTGMGADIDPEKEDKQKQLDEAEDELADLEWELGRILDQLPGTITADDPIPPHIVLRNRGLLTRIQELKNKIFWLKVDLNLITSEDLGYAPTYVPPEDSK